jgi:ectoine hydroxylase-related dioxygenase (phytanoyl-CoA dioxygenase family)
MLTAEQRATFDRDGILALRGAFTGEQAAAMRAVIWRELERRHGIVEGDRSTWTVERPYGMKSSKKSRVFAAILGPEVRAVLDDLFGSGAWIEPKHMGQVLITFPGSAPWAVPSKLWHADFASEGVEGLFAVKLWAVVGDLPPGAGGTPQLAGSHRAFARHLATLENREYKHARDSFMRSHPWLRSIGDASVDEEVDVDGLPLRVVELTGRPGDVFLTHPWVFHSIAVNASDVPRLMRSHAIRRAP